MAELKKCRKCGEPVQANAPFGHCPKCLLAVGFGSETGDPQEPSDDSALHAPDSPLGRARSFGDYELLDQIGRGGMGIVFKAHQKSLNRVVALKMILNVETASPVAMARFHLEAEAAAKLEHPHIVSTHDFGEIDGQPFFSMRLIEGSNLAKQMPHLSLPALAGGDQTRASKTSSREAQERIARLMTTIARAIHYAHQHGVVHRDLKPTNILIDQQTHPYLTDFGVAKMLTGASGLTGTDDVLGTPSYMSPEQAAGRPATHSADIYSLGVILYELLTGRPPFRANTPMETLRRVTEEEPTHPTTLNRQADRELATICLKCLEKDPLRRYASAEAMAEDLERWLRREPIHARRAAPIVRVTRWVRRNPTGAGLITVLCVMLALVLVLFVRVYREQQSKREHLRLVQANVKRSLDDLWANPGDNVETIRSEMLAALRGDLAPSSLVSFNRLDLLFAVYTHQEPTKMLEIMAPILFELERKMALRLSRPVRIDLRIYRDYDDAQATLVSGKVDFMRLGSSSYVEVKAANSNVTLLAKQNGKIRGYIFANATAGIRSNSLTDLKGKSMAFVDDSSTTGNYLAKLELLQVGLAAQDLRGGSTNYRGAHDAVVKDVAAFKFVAGVAVPKFDAGAANASVVDGFMRNPTNRGKLTIVSEFHEAMGLPWVGSPSLNPNVATNISAALFSIKDQTMLNALGNGTSAFVEGKDEDYNQLRDAMGKASDFDRVLPKPPGTP